MTETPNIRLRKTVYKDIKTILNIEKQQFPHPWPQHFFNDEISHDISYFYVAEDIRIQQPVGYIIFWIIEEEMELHKIAVSQAYRNRGIGKGLFQFMLKTAKEKKIEKIFLEVRKSNIAAIKLYESFNFKLIGIRKKYYNDPLEDAMTYCLDTFSKR